MKVLILSPYPEAIIKTLKRSNDTFLTYKSNLRVEFLEENNIEFIISYGYKYILKEEIINKFKNNIINLHISYLPFNKGYYPNLWSHLEGTPCGVSIHRIDKGIDTGEILIQKKCFFDKQKLTFKNSYEILRKELEELFRENWELLKRGKISSMKSTENGTFRSKIEGDEILKLLDKGWDTKINTAIKIYHDYLFTKEKSSLD